MSEFYIADSANTRKNSSKVLSEILQAVASKTQTRIAEELGCSTSTVSRLLSDDLPKVCEVLAVLGLKLVPATAMVTSREEAKALMRMAIKYLKSELDEY